MSNQKKKIIMLDKTETLRPLHCEFSKWVKSQTKEHVSLQRLRQNLTLPKHPTPSG